MTLLPSRDAAPSVGDGVEVKALPGIADEHIPVFGARSRAKKLAAELTELRTRVGRLGVPSVVELDEPRHALEVETAELAANLARERTEAVTTVEKEINLERAQAETALSGLRTEREGIAAYLERERAQAAALVTRETFRIRAEAEAESASSRRKRSRLRLASQRYGSRWWLPKTP